MEMEVVSEGNCSIEASATTIFDLPFEDIVLTHIAKYFKLGHLINLRMCSRDFKDLAERILERMTIIDDRSNLPFLLRNVSVAARYCQRLKILRFNEMPGITVWNYPDYMIDYKVLGGLFAKNPLTEFRFTGSRRYNSHKGLLKAFSRIDLCKSLTNLELRGTRLSNAALEKFESLSLERINITNCRGFKEHTLVRFFMRQPLLKRITLVDSLTDIRSSLVEIADRCRRVETINVCESRTVDDEVVLDIVMYCRNLRIFLFCTETLQHSLSKETLDFLSSKNIRTSVDQLNKFEKRNL